MCGFCDGKEKDIVNNPEHRWSILELNGVFYIAYKDKSIIGSQCISIDYCPYCGRKLSGDECTSVDEEEIIRSIREASMTSTVDLSDSIVRAREFLKKYNREKDLENKIKELESELAVKENLLKIKAGIETDYDMEYAKLRIAELEDRYQSDCITINQLNTTIDVLVDKLNTLRKLNGL